MTPAGGRSEDVVALLRSIGSTVHAGEVEAERRAAALDHLQAAHDLLSGGAPRRRWYEVDADAEFDDDGASTRARNRELSTFSGSLNPVAPPMRIEAGNLADGRAALIGSVRLNRLREGPPHAVHGGVIAGLFDEILGGGQRLGGGPPGMTGRLTVRYRLPTPLETDLEFRVWIHDERARHVVVRGECVVRGSDDAAETMTAEAEAIFLRVDFDELGPRMRPRVDGAAPAPPPEALPGGGR